MFEEDAVVRALLLLEGAEELVEVVERRLDALLLGGGEGRCQLAFLYSDLALMYRVTNLDGYNLPLTWVWEVPSSCPGSR